MKRIADKPTGAKKAGTKKVKKVPPTAASKTLPRVLDPLSVEDFIAAIKDTNERGGKAQLLLFTPEKGKMEATRNVASNHAAMCTVDLSITPFPTPQAGTETYITAEDGYQMGQGGKPHSENKYMRDDWHGFHLAMSFLLKDATTHRILIDAFGQDFRLLPERGYWRNASLTKDLQLSPEKLLVHKDHPKWIRSKTEQVEVVTAKCKAGQVAWVLLDQAEFHGIPGGGDCVGWLLSVVSPQKFEQYTEKVESHLNKLRSGKLKAVNHDPEGHQEGFTGLDALLYDFCKGSRPHLYESGKIIQAPHGMAASNFPARQHRYLSQTAFARIRGTPPCDSVDVIMTRLRERGLASAFQKVAQAGPWNVDPSSFSDDALLRFFGIRPIFKQRENAGNGKKHD